MLDIPIDETVDAFCARKPERLPAVMTKEEALEVISAMSGKYQIISMLLYGSGLRDMESLRLRVKDIDFSRCQINVREGKGSKDRVTVLPDSAARLLKKQLKSVEGNTPEGPGCLIWLCLDAGCLIEKISERCQGLGVAVCFSGKHSIDP